MATREDIDAHKRATGITPMPAGLRERFDREYPDGSAYRLTAEEAIEWALTWCTKHQPTDELQAARDMLDDARLRLEMIRDVLGVERQPHQSVEERVVEAVRALVRERERWLKDFRIQQEEIIRLQDQGTDNDGTPLAPGTRTALMRKINNLMTLAGHSLTEDQDAALCAALGALWEEITGPAQPASFRPDWVNYAQGLDDGRAEAEEALSRDAEPWHWIVQRYGSPPDKGWIIWAGRRPDQCTGRNHIACLGDGDESEQIARTLCDAHNAAIAAEREGNQ